MNFQRNEILHKNLKIRNCETRNLQTQYQTIDENETKISQMQTNYVLITQLQKTKNEILKKNVQIKNTFEIEFRKKTSFDFFVDEFFFLFSINVSSVNKRETIKNSKISQNQNKSMFKVFSSFFFFEFFFSFDANFENDDAKSFNKQY